MPSLPRRIAPAALLLAALFSQPPSAAAQPGEQTKEGAQAKEPAVFCDPARALLLVGQHLAEARSLENPAQRIGVMVRGAELLWASREQEARAVFAEAFELASAHFREHGDRIIPDPQTRKDKQGSGLMIQLPDQRFVVIRAVARHDSAWARELADAAVEESKRETEKKAADAKRNERNPADKLLPLAESLLAEDLAAALSVARGAFRHPVAYTFPRFLYSVAKVDRAAADAFYLEALDAYARAQPDALLALSAYPFATHMLVGNPRDLGPPGIPPPGFAPNPAFQKAFVAAFLAYADSKLKALAARQTEEGATPDAQEVTQIFIALGTLETIYGPTDPGFAARVFPLKESAGAMLTGVRRQAATSAAGRPLNWNAADGNPAGRYERVLEGAAMIPDPERRDGHLMRGLTSLVRDESAERLAAAADKISDEAVRRQFLDFVYNEKSQQAMKEGKPDEAVRLAEKVEPFDQRAVLLLGVAAEGLRTSDDRQRAITLLEEVVRSAQRAPDTEAKARALLGAAHLYTKFDYLRALDVIGEAVKTVNRLKDPELSLPVIRRRIEGRTHGYYTANNAPGFTLENAFRELSRRDFEGAAGAARNLEDRHLRATAAMALAAECIEESAKAAKKETPAAGNTPAAKKPRRQREPPKP